MNIRLPLRSAVLLLAMAPLCLAAPHATPTDWAWTSQPWSDSDTAYANSQSQISALWEAKTMNPEDLSAYKKLAQTFPDYPIMLFRWGYYAYCYSLLEPAKAGPEIKEVAQALDSHPTPNSYPYARLRYLIAQASGEANTPTIQQLGARLLRRYPGDDRIAAHQKAR